MENTLPKVGISQRIVNAENYDEKRDALSHEWTSFLEKLGIVPILIPNSLTSVKNFLQQFQIDGIILSGGDDVGKHPERDDTEKAIIEYVIKNSIPTLGVCRGMQIINSYFGGIISKNPDSSHVNHSHSLQIHTDEFLKILPESIEVNSFHNNVINQKNLGEELTTFAIDKRDETIEGLYHKKLPIIGVMWHPERSQNQINKSLLTNLFLNQNFFKNLN